MVAGLLIRQRRFDSFQGYQVMYYGLFALLGKLNIVSDNQAEWAWRRFPAYKFHARVDQRQSQYVESVSSAGSTPVTSTKFGRSCAV
jgi:hypothetical protein